MALSLTFSENGRGTEQMKTEQVNPDHLSGHFRGHFRGYVCGMFRGELTLMGALVGALVGANVGRSNFPFAWSASHPNFHCTLQPQTAPVQTINFISKRFRRKPLAKAQATGRRVKWDKENRNAQKVVGNKLLRAECIARDNSRTPRLMSFQGGSWNSQNIGS